MSLPVFNFTIPQGGRLSFQMVVVDDRIVEDHKEAVYFEIGVYSSGQKTVMSDARIYIEDNDGNDSSQFHNSHLTSTKGSC